MPQDFVRHMIRMSDTEAFEKDGAFVKKAPSFLLVITEKYKGKLPKIIALLLYNSTKKNQRY